MSHYELLRPDSDLPTPITTKAQFGATRLSPKMRLLAFFGTAATSGILFHMLLLGFGGANSKAVVPVVKDWLNDRPPPTEIGDVLPHSTAPGMLPESACPVNITNAYIRPGLGSYVVPDEDVWALSRVRDMVAKTKGFYVRDYSLGLGWNNVSHCTLVAYAIGNAYTEST